MHMEVHAHEYRCTERPEEAGLPEARVIGDWASGTGRSGPLTALL